ncbi:MAG: NAD-dependent dehydratase, partial [Magnetococcales bacterium]|nr:NAD-dependent dehydratase [Magnetococcales bacterium]
NRSVYLVTDGHDYSTTELYTTIVTAMGRPLPRWFIPLGLLRLLASAGSLLGQLSGQRAPFDRDALDKLTGSACYRPTAIQRDLGYQPCWTLAQAMADLILEPSP